MKMPDRMRRLYERLEAFGIDRNYVREVAFPPGWNDAATENPAVYCQAIGLLARNLNLNLRALQTDEAPLEWQDCGPARFKHGKRLSEQDLTLARCLAARAAQVACQAATTPVTEVPAAGRAIRETLLATGRPYVDFEALLDYCWASGIPVLPVSRLPAHARKPNALAGTFSDRPAIVLMKQPRYAAMLLFILAHELGHIALGHLSGNGLLVDAHIDRDDREAQEEQANAFAVELLTGKPDIRYRAAYSPTAEELANAARETSRRDGVDPGFVALIYAGTRGHSAVGNRALSLIEPEADPIGTIRARICSRLDWEQLGRDSGQFLQSITRTD
jgi:hypothetical protein